MDPLVLGMGASGLSVMRYLAARGQRPWGVEAARENLERARGVMEASPGAWRLHLESEFRCAYLRSVSALYCSPGVAGAHPILRRVRELQLPVFTDIDLFLAAQPRGKVAAVTGVNGKSTICAWLAHVLQRSGRSAAACGNFGLPVLEALGEDPDYYVLELSSFQLERTGVLGADVAAFVDFSEDHRDRHPSPAEHLAAKNRVFRGATKGVYPESLLYLTDRDPQRQDLLYSPADSQVADCCIRDGSLWHRGEEVCPLPDRSDLGAGWRNSALATFSLAVALGLPPAEVVPLMQGFPGLPHRCRPVGEAGGALWVDDAKGTNPGATEAAVAAFRSKGPIVLLLGGNAKSADLRRLGRLEGVRDLLYFGSDAERIGRAVGGGYRTARRCSGLEEAVREASELAGAGDVVLFSPACASDPEEGGYERRGRRFAELLAQAGKSRPRVPA